MGKKKTSQSIFQSIPLPTLVLSPIGPDHRVLDVNRAFKQILDDSPDNLIGKPFFELFPGDPDNPHDRQAQRQKQSLDYVSHEGKPDDVGVQNFDLPNPNTGELETYWYQISNIPVVDEGEITAIIHTVRDVTVQHQQREEIKIKEKRFRSLVENGNDLLLILSPEGQPTYASPTITSILGYSREEVLNFNPNDIVHPDDLPHVMEELNLALRNPAMPISVTPARMRHKNGSWRWFDGTITNMIQDPAIGGVVDNFRDITEKVEAENQIREAKEKFESLVHTIDGIFWEADPETFIFDFVSPQAKEILGYSPEDWIGVPDFWQQKIHPDDREKAIQYCHHETQIGRNHEFQYRIQRADGEYIWMRDVVTVVKRNGKPHKLRGFMLDITRQKKLEMELNDAYRLAKIGNWELNLEKNDLLWSDYVHAIHEVGPDFKPDLELALQFYEEGESRDRITEAVERAINHGEPFDLECTILTAGGQRKWVRAVGQPRLRDGTCISIYGTTQDITERKSAEIAELENRNRLENIMIESMDVICIVDPNGYFETVSAASTEIWGYTPEELEGTKFIQYVHPDDLEKTEQVAEDLLSGVKTNSFENRYIHKDGSVVPVIWTARWNPDDNKIYGIARDARELKEAQKRLADTEQHLRNIIEHTTNLFYEHDAEGVLTFISPQSQQFFGYPPEEARRHWTDFITDHPANSIGEERTRQAIESGKAQPPYELQLKKATGEIIWVEVNEAPVVQNGETVSVVGALTDITERKNYEEKLKELSLVASKTTDLVLITDADERITWANRAFEKLTEYSFQEAQGKKPGELLQGPGSDPDTKRKIRAALDQKEPVDAVILNYSKSGRPYWLEMHIDPIFDEAGNHTHFISIERDVTEKIEREKQLRESLERYEIVSKATSDTIWDMNLASGDITYNNNICHMFGYKADEVYPAFEWWKKKLHPDDRFLINQKIRKVLTEGTERFQLEYRFQASDGTYKHIFDRAFLIKDESGEPVRMIGAMQDITTEVLEQQELELRESVITNANDTVVITKAKPIGQPGREIIYVNDAFLRLTGYSKKEVLGKTMEILNGPETDREELQRIGACLDQWEACEAEFLNYRKDGSTFWIHVSLVPVKDKHGHYTHWIIIGRDISDYKKHEQELMDSLSEKETLLAEIHHRVKNNLAIVSSLMQLQALSTENRELRTKLFESVLRIKSMANIHEQLYKSHSFSKLKLSRNIRNLVQTIVETMAPDKEIRLEFELDTIEININQGVPASLIVNEVLTNIVKHAFNGREKGVIKISLMEKDQRVSLQIEDDGVGLPDNFDEMKKVSLGLELIDVLTRQIEGENEFVSNKGSTCFRLEFTKKELKGAGSGFVNGS